MAIILYELSGDQDRRFSPYCWRTRLALAHKGLDYETVPVRFTAKDVIAFSNQERVPVIRDGKTVVSDSWSIACYLEDTYPARPSLFGGDQARLMTSFFNAWTDSQINLNAVSLLVKDVYDLVDKRDRDYFLQSREKRFGMSLDALHAARDGRRDAVRDAFQPARITLSGRDFFCGDSPGYADYILMGTLQWLRMVTSYQVLEPEDPVIAWRARMFDRLGSVLLDAPAFDS